MALLSLVAIYNYDNTVLEDLKNYVPKHPSNTDYAVLNFTPIDFDTLKSLILLRAAEMSLVYSDIDLFKFALRAWSAANKDVWQRLYDTLWYKYDPLFSKIRTYTLERKTRLDRDTTEHTEQGDTNTTEREDNTKTDRDRNTKTTENTTAHDGTNETVNRSGNDSATDTQYVQAFNDIGASRWHEKEQNRHTGDVHENATTNSSEDITQQVSGSESTDEDIITQYTQDVKELIDREINKNGKQLDVGKVDDIIKETITGQRAYQELIVLQREIAEFNLYDYIVEDFVRHFCVMVY